VLSKGIKANEVTGSFSRDNNVLISRKYSKGQVLKRHIILTMDRGDNQASFEIPYCLQFRENQGRKLQQRYCNNCQYF
jgi:hypothetical protein